MRANLADYSFTPWATERKVKLWRRFCSNKVTQILRCEPNSSRTQTYKQTIWLEFFPQLIENRVANKWNSINW